MTHDSYRELIQRELDDDLTFEESTRLDLHTAECAECRREREEYRQLALGLQSLAAVMPERSFVSQMEFDIDEFLRPQPQKPLPLQKKGLRRLSAGWWQGLSVAAIVVLAIGLTAHFLPGSSSQMAQQDSRGANPGGKPSPTVTGTNATTGDQVALGGNSGSPQGATDGTKGTGGVSGAGNGGSAGNAGTSGAGNGGSAGVGGASGAGNGGSAGIGGASGAGNGGSIGVGGLPGAGTGISTGSGGLSGTGNGSSAGSGAASGAGTGSTVAMGGSSDPESGSSGSSGGASSSEGSGTGGKLGAGSGGPAISGGVGGTIGSNDGNMGITSDPSDGSDVSKGFGALTSMLKDRDRYYGLTAGALAAEQPPLPMIVGSITYTPREIDAKLQEQVRQGNPSARWGTIPSQVVQHTLTEIGFAPTALVTTTDRLDRVNVTQGGQRYQIRLVQPFDMGVDGIWQPAQISRELPFNSQEPTDQPILQYFNQLHQETGLTITGLHVEENLLLNRTVIGADLLYPTDNEMKTVYFSYNFKLKLNKDYTWSLDGAPFVVSQSW